MTYINLNGSFGWDRVNQWLLLEVYLGVDYWYVFLLSNAFIWHVLRNWQRERAVVMSKCVAAWAMLTGAESRDTPSPIMYYSSISTWTSGFNTLYTLHLLHEAPGRVALPCSLCRRRPPPTRIVPCLPLSDRWECPFSSWK